MAVKKDPRTLELAEPFVSLFPVDPTTLKLVTDSIRERGFQADKPLLVWKDAFGDRGRPVVVDGHTRLRAALDLKLKEIPANMRQFKNVDAAITAGVGEQVQRRNLNREQIAAYVVSILPLLDETKDGLRSRTTKQLAAMLGVSTATIDRARGVLASNNEVLIEAVKSGGMSLLAAYGEVTGNPQWANPQTAPSEERASAGHELTAEQVESLQELAVDVGRALTPEPALDDEDPDPESVPPLKEALANLEETIEKINKGGASSFFPLTPWMDTLGRTLGEIVKSAGEIKALRLRVTIQQDDGSQAFTDVEIDADGNVATGPVVPV